MLSLFTTFLEKINFPAVVGALRKRKNRLIAARLHLILIQSYEIIELYRILLNELRAALESYQRTDTAHRFLLNPSRIADLLERQSSNLSVMETLTGDLLDELRILDNKFLQAYQTLFPGKAGMLFEAQRLLENGRLPLSEGEPDTFPANRRGEYRTLWFTPKQPEGDREQIAQHLHGYTGVEKSVIDVNIHEGDTFFRELGRYFKEEDPEGRLRVLELLTERYKTVILEHFSVEDLLADIGKIRRHYTRAP